MNQSLLFLLSLSLGAFCVCQQDDFIMQGNSEDLGWNLFSLLVNVGGALGTCIPMATLTGMVKPICALTSVATMSTFSCLMLRIYDGMIAREGITQDVQKFIKRIGLDIKPCDEDVSVTSTTDEGMWALWDNSEVARSLRRLQMKVDFKVDMKQNSEGQIRSNYCFQFETGSYPNGRPIIPYRQEICLTKFAVRKFANNKLSNMPAKCLLATVASLKTAGWKESVDEARKFVKNMYMVFGDYTEEFVQKVTDMVDALSGDDPTRTSYTFIISDTFEGNLEQMISVSVSTIDW
ncbi:LAFE_0G15522g1_1 [Lachancea fermentati]|uniref:LAFE_0G15522g1_1 n=1 Tax=Lachancea fermentati TaxID=4955 RepID=A0A1G4MID8_LACFM|nr:LAFE_0G15522g1_1 [Lachancea fermentati]